jgi:vacuolar protein sorting-associated protein VTA1
VAAKSKYAKFHALRIAKALKAGEDPNLSNPVQEQPTTPSGLLSPNDPEVQLLNSLQPTVEDASDNSRPPSFQDTRPTPLPPNSRSPTIQPFPQAPTQGDVSPLEPSPNEGYFPNVPTFTADNQPPSLPTASEDVVMGDPPIGSPQDFYNVQPSPQQPPLPPRAPTQPQIPSIHPSHQAPAPQFSAPAPAPVLSTAQPVIRQPQPLPQAVQPEPQRAPGNYLRDDEAVLAAQKHAKWAISALNFEDVDTAVSELRIALRALGAS